ncbi:tyrosine-type recombinase/integrase [Photobacterium carnosum]|uniref:site-specific integrase n=1 Tax=Photobacterium carnosum TaxID=2023717 RepID=UPI001C9114C3|nr:site-specific integrase [Photobacterium carnosum]MBY3789531.1 tyrosine-type recombinase/integrase [Photobacterium carnosum]MCD9514001.1 tyrosine-type recombinase/integrase [Photobacterium carnosum]MCD9534590.1 tyrosine-type recombinase/integrase [Photobacterium carnosum]
MYPEGIEVRGSSLRICFIYKETRCRETLKGWTVTPSNIKKAGRLRAVIVSEIACGEFDYYLRFPNSKKSLLFGGANNNGAITLLGDLIKRWLIIKETDYTPETLKKSRNALNVCSNILDKNRSILNITHEDALTMRRDLLQGMTAYSNRENKKGRSVNTVNTYITVCNEFFSFAVRSGFIKKNPFNNVGHLTVDRESADPLEVDEFERLISALSTNEQAANLWTIAVYTGLRHGELCSLAWEDIDLERKTLTVKRNLTSKNRFKVPKTKAGERTVNLLSPAIEALKRQRRLSFLRPANETNIALRQKGKDRIDVCTWVFVTGLSAHGKSVNNGYIGNVGINRLWHSCVKRAGIRTRNPYQTRHTYACWMLSQGVNPAFIASQMGHKDMTMVLKVYGAWMQSGNESEIEKMERALNCRAPSVPHLKINKQ